MAAATMAGADGHRMEQKKLEYFSSINSMARKIMQERENIKERHGPDWEKMTPNEQDSAIDNGMMDPHIRARYAMHKVDREEVICYPKLLIQTGQKIVHFGVESQLDFSLTTGESVQGISSSTANYKPTNVTQSSQLSKVSNGESLGLGRKEESSSFWKISAERSRLEGEQTDFQSLTPSQIKSLEKGEKPLPSYLRQEPTPKEAEETPPPLRVTSQRSSRPPAPPPPVPIGVPPPAAISVTPMSVTPTPALISVSSTVAGWEHAQSTLPSVINTVEDFFTPGLVNKSPGLPTNSPARSGNTARDREEKAAAQSESQLATSPTFAQLNTSSNVLKTGFDFLDNW
uniref:Chromosome 1 open reading frame 198 n=1 Tax=Salmo trutta TaxID=8032 RepID=A0A673Y7R6_SALTR